jgi:glycosyltransferase involved in cell wall biosynthesis
VIYNAIDFEEFNPELANESKIRKEFGISEETKLVGMIGRITLRKRYEDFLRAASKVLEDFPNTKFIAVGGTYSGLERGYEEKVRKLVKALELQDKVIFTGFRKDIPDIMSTLDVLVLPSLKEPFGRVIIEALILGTPVVAANSGGIPEIIQNGRTGLLVPPKNPDELAKTIIKLLENGDFAKNLAIQGKKEVKQRFSADKITRLEEELYLEILEGK